MVEEEEEEEEVDKKRKWAVRKLKKARALGVVYIESGNCEAFDLVLWLESWFEALKALRGYNVLVMWTLGGKRQYSRLQYILKASWLATENS